MIELFRSEQVVVRCLPAADTRRWIITFDNYGIGHGFDRPGFGQTFLAQSGISAIHVMGVREDWYQYPEMAEAMARVRQHVAGAERVMTYGSSMGGYAAIRFAEAVEATSVLALSPQYSVDPAKVPFEMRWTQDGGRIQWLPEIDGKLINRVAPIIVYDPIIEDAQHVALLEQDIPIQSIRLPHTGHPTTASVAEMGLLKTLVMQTLDGSLNLPSFAREARLGRRRSPTYLSNLAVALDQKPQHASKALAVAEFSVEISKGHLMSVIALSRIQSRQGLHDAAIRTLESVAQTHGKSDVFLIPYANAYLAAGQYEQALSIAEVVVNRPPEMAHLRAWKAHMHWEAQQFELAHAEVLKAHAMDPINENFLTMLEGYEVGLGLRPLPTDPQETVAVTLSEASRPRRWWSPIVCWVKGQRTD